MQGTRSSLRSIGWASAYVVFCLGSTWITAGHVDLPAVSWVALGTVGGELLSTWVALCVVTAVGVVGGEALSGAIGGIRRSLWWIPVTIGIVGAFPLSKHLTAAITSPVGVFTPIGGVESFTVLSLLIVALAVALARLSFTATRRQAIMIGLATSWWMLSAATHLSFAPIPTLFSQRMGPGEVFVARLALGLSIALSVRLLDRIAGGDGASLTARNDGPAVARFVPYLAALGIAGVSVWVSSLRVISPGNSPLPAFRTLQVIPLLLSQWLVVTAVPIGLTAGLAWAVRDLPQRLTLPRAVTIAAGMVWFLGVAPRWFAVGAAGTPYTSRPETFPLMLLGLTVAAICAYGLLVLALQIPQPLAVSAAGLFVLWVDLQSDWVARPVRIAMTRGAPSVQHLLANSLLSLMIAGASLVVFAVITRGVRRRLVTTDPTEQREPAESKPGCLWRSVD